MFSLKTTALDPAQPAILWKTNYWRKKEDKLHKSEDDRLCPLPFTQVGLIVMVEKFLDYKTQLPKAKNKLQYAKLKAFLAKENLQMLIPSSSETRATILLDEQKDPHSAQGATRDWDDSYFDRPPESDPQSLFFELMPSSQFITRLNEIVVRICEVVYITEIKFGPET
jgi:hypothetical protein